MSVLRTALALCLLLSPGASAPTRADDSAAATTIQRYDATTLAPLIRAETSELTFAEQPGGVQRVRIRIVEEDGVPLLLCEERTAMRVRIFGAVTESEDVTREWYSLEAPGFLVRGERTTIEDGETVASSVVREGDVYKLTTTVEGETGVERFSADDLTVAKLLEEELWIRALPEAGEMYESSRTDWTDPRTTSEIRAVSLGRTEIERDGETIAVLHVRITEDGMTLDHSQEIDGRRAWGSMQGGLIAYTTVPADPSMEIDDPLPPIGAGEAVDITAFGKIAIDIPLGAEERLEELVLRAEGVPAEDFPSGPGQTVEVLGPKSVRITTRAGNRVTEPMPLTGVDRALYTMRTPKFRTEDPALIELASSLVYGVREPIAVGSILSDWVFNALAYDPAANSDRSDTILAAEAGDCTEHAILFVALARVRGLPARTVTGLVWTEDEEYGDGFYRHAWAEFHDGNRWISVDPTWGQIGVDAGHIRLDEAFDEEAGAEMHEPWFRFELERVLRSPPLD